MSFDEVEQYDWISIFPREFNYDNEIVDIWDKLLTEGISIFEKKQMTDIFLYSVLLGINHPDGKKPLKKPKGGVSSHAFSPQEKSLLLAMMIANSKEGLEVLMDKSELRKSLEQYANRGIHVLEDIILQGNKEKTITRLEQEIRDLLFDPKKEAQKKRLEKDEQISRVGPAMQEIAKFESGLRELIPIVLGKITKDWKDSLPDKKMIERWNDVIDKNSERFRTFGKEDISIMDGAYLGDLQAIVINRANYSSFKEIFGEDKDGLKHDFGTVVLIRNDPAHSYGLTEAEFKMLMTVLEHRNNQISQALTKLYT